MYKYKEGGYIAYCSIGKGFSFKYPTRFKLTRDGQDNLVLLDTESGQNDFSFSVTIKTLSNYSGKLFSQTGDAGGSTETYVAPLANQNQAVEFNVGFYAPIDTPETTTSKQRQIDLKSLAKQVIDTVKSGC